MNKQKGMTLLEVLVALAIFSLAGLTLLQTTAQQARNAGMMKEKMLASWLADNQ
ncbi:type II secretion system minor pseudopilin GspI, partial [Enterobacter ludwigii]